MNDEDALSAVAEETGVEPAADLDGLRFMAPLAAALAVFAVAAVTVPLQSRAADIAVLVGSGAMVVLARRAGGISAALFAGCVSALSFDFFHVHPLRVLHPRTLVVALVVAALVAVASP